MTRNPFVLVVSTLLGTVIGAGVFGLPYVVAQSGVLVSLFYFLLIGVFATFLHLCVGEISLRTQEKARLIGYAKRYLGKWGELILAFTTLFGGIGALLVYIILGGTFLHVIFPPVSSALFSLLFGTVLSLFIFQGIQLISRIEFFTNAALFIAVFAILFFAMPYFESANFALFPSFTLADWFLPYGVMFFSLTGWIAVPEVAELFKTKKEKDRLLKAIVLAGVLSVVFYAIFSFAVVGVSGAATSQDALSGLVPFLGESIVVFGAVFGLITLADSYLIFGNYLKNSLAIDYRIPKTLAFLMVMGAPLVLFLLGVREFIGVLGVVGTLIGTIEGGAILFMFSRAKKLGDRKPEYSIPLTFPFLFTIGSLLFLAAGGALFF